MTLTATEPAIARVNGQPLHAAAERPTAEELRRRACTELLRQAAQAAGLLGVEDRASVDGIPSQDAYDAIERLLEKQLHVPTADDATCQRHYEATQALWRRNEAVHARHVLFAVTPGVDVRALRERAEELLLEVRAASDPTAFARRAQDYSNCPSGAAGGDLGWLQANECAPEFASAVFGHDGIGVLPRLVHSRFGLHVVEVLARRGGERLAFSDVRAAVGQSLQQQSWARSLRDFLQQLASQARIEGVAGLDA